MEIQSIYHAPVRITSGRRTAQRPNHRGVDLVGDGNKTVHTPMAGTVLQSRMVVDRSNLTWEWGNYVSIRFTNGLTGFFCHLDSRAVVAGQQVVAGQPIGVEGNTGHSFGSHLHYEVRNAAGVDVDPLPFFVQWQGNTPAPAPPSTPSQLFVVETGPMTRGDVNKITAHLQEWLASEGIATPTNGVAVTTREV